MNNMDAYMRDEINSPDHYTVGGIETIDYLKAKLTPEEFRGYLKGNALKYLSRATYKGHSSKDHAKAQWYINRLVQEESMRAEQQYECAGGSTVAQRCGKCNCAVVLC